MSITTDDQTSWSSRQCAICGSKAIGINFGVSTCSPCKAFFRRNARRKQILDLPCQHRNINLPTINNHNSSIHYLIIRRCSSCRLRRCFNMGMKEELVRTDEENIRYKQLVDTNRQRRELFKKKQQEKQLSIPQCIAHNNQFLHESDWRHLSNIVSAYDTHCLKTYVQQRSTMYINEITSYNNERISVKYYTALPISLTISVFSFIRSLPAFHSLSQINRTYLCKNNLRPLLFPTMVELNQLCFSEPWQISRDKTTWEIICGPKLFEQFIYTEKLAEKSLITDPIITRLWIVILFFSSSLCCLYDGYISIKIPKTKSAIIEIQNAYIALLWNYLLHRYGNFSAIQIYSDLIHVYLNMQRVGCNIGIQVRTRDEIMIVHETLNKLLKLDIRDSLK